LFPGTKNYKTLEVSLTLLCQDLIQLKNNGINDTSGKHWNVELYFSADWKFLAIFLGFNVANSNFFCP
ncbi:16250_t:CDS:1, partial [Cetraspora pellucida]